MKYFITGATGFIGGEVARQLLAAGHEVIALARTPSKAQALTDRGATVVPGDVTDRDSMRGPMTGVDGVFHIAALYQIGNTHRQQMEQINVEGTRNVLTLMRELAIPKGVYTSTIGVFSDTGGRMVDETYTHTGPFLNNYEHTKWQAHYEIAQPMQADGLPLVIVMPGLVYGPGDTSVVRKQLIEALRGRMWLLPTGVEFCWAHVEDTACGHILAMERGTPGEAYLITGPRWPFAEALRVVHELSGIRRPLLNVPPAAPRILAAAMSWLEKVLPVPDVYTAEALRTWAGVTYLARSDKAQRELGFTARPVEDGWRETVRHEMRLMGMTPRD
jgi:nucleoside-diphosphate-sugar epimerase